MLKPTLPSPVQCRDGWYMLDGQCIESCPAGMTSLGVSQFRRRCLAPFECQRGRIVGQEVNYGCRCATDENTPSSCQFCSFRADEQGQYCTRCLGSTFLYNNRCQAGCDGLLESEGLISYIPGTCECPTDVPVPPCSAPIVAFPVCHDQPLFCFHSGNRMFCAY